MLMIIGKSNFHTFSVILYDSCVRVMDLYVDAIILWQNYLFLINDTTVEL